MFGCCEAFFEPSEGFTYQISLFTGVLSLYSRKTHKNTVIHEFSHALTCEKFGIRYLDHDLAHGKTFRKVMRRLGEDPDYRDLISDEFEDYEGLCGCKEYRDSLSRLPDGRHILTPREAHWISLHNRNVWCCDCGLPIQHTGAVFRDGVYTPESKRLIEAIWISEIQKKMFGSSL